MIAARNIKSLTSLRGLAAAAVMEFHFAGDLSRGMSHGYIGVDLFFLLSGFVLFHVYHDGQFSPRSFIVARFARTYPLHLFSLLLFLPAYGKSAAFSGSALLCNISMTQAVCGVDRAWNSVSWSLSAEWFAYLLFPFILGPLKRCQARMAGILAGICLLVLAAQGVRLTATFGALALCRSVPEFLIGVLAYRLFAAGLFAGWGWFVASSAAVLFSSLLGAPDVVTVAALVIVLLSAPSVTLLEWRPFVFLGEISYSVYMLHMFVGLLALAIVRDSGLRSAFWVAPIGSVLAIGFATLTYRAIEVPARLKLRTWLDKDWVPVLA